MSATGIRTYLDADMAREVSRLARAQGRSESAFIADAVRTVVAQRAPGAAAAAADTQTRRLNRLEARLDGLWRDQALIRESLLLYVRVWLEHNPPLDEALADDLAASAQARFERFLDLAAQTHARGGAMRVFGPPTGTVADTAAGAGTVADAGGFRDDDIGDGADPGAEIGPGPGAGAGPATGSGAAGGAAMMAAMPAGRRHASGEAHNGRG